MENRDGGILLFERGVSFNEKCQVAVLDFFSLLSLCSIELALGSLDCYLIKNLFNDVCFCMSFSTCLK